MRFFANIPIVIKILFIAAVPLVMLSWVMFDDIRQAFKEEVSMQTMLQAAGLGEAASSLVDELQKERGMFAGFLGSEGKKFSVGLKAQKSLLDQAIFNLREAIKASKPLIHAYPSLQEIIDHFMLDMNRIDDIRQRAWEMNITVYDELEYYSDMVNDLLQITNYIRIMYTYGAHPDNEQAVNMMIVPNARFSGLLTSFILLGRVEEAAGTERAVLTNTFSQDRFGPDMYEYFVSLVAQQHNTLHEFSVLSPEHIGQMFSSHYRGEAVTQVEKIRGIAMAKARDGSFGIDPEQWFRLSSQRIDLLQQVEREIVELIRQYSREGLEQAIDNVRFIIIRELVAILFAAGVSFAAAWLLLLGIRHASQAMQSIEAGDYNVAIPDTGGDELGRMLGGIERMRRSLVITEQARAVQEKKAMVRLKALQSTRDELYKGRDIMGRLLAAIPSILIGVDSEGFISLWNESAEKVFGLGTETIMNTPFATLAIEWDWEKINQSLTESEALYSCSLDNVKFKRNDGSDGFLGLTINSVMEDGKYNGFLLFGSDITEHIHLENQLHLAQKMEAVGELAAGIAHEINTPMQYIGDNIRFLKDGFTDLLQLIACYDKAMKGIGRGKLTPVQGVSDIKQAGEDADINFLRDEMPMAIAQTLEGVDHVSKIVGAMKEFSHPGTKEKVFIDINKVIKNTVTVSRNEWKYVAELEIELDPGLPMVHVLPEINQVFLNIIINAAHAIAETLPEGDEKKGQIHISTSHTGDVVEIRISDSGPGIAPEKQDKIFDPFYTTKAPGKGTGQGLSISHQIVCNRLGGRIFVESEPDHGASFIIQLPVNSEA